MLVKRVQKFARRVPPGISAHQLRELGFPIIVNALFDTERDQQFIQRQALRRDHSAQLLRRGEGRLCRRRRRQRGGAVAVTVADVRVHVRIDCCGS